LQLLTGGEYDAHSALFLTPEGRAKFFVSTDRLQSDAYRMLRPRDVFDVAAREGLNFEHTSQTGAVFHMLTTLGRHGFVGLTAVGDSREDAGKIFDRTRSSLDRAAREASRERELLPFE
jgi:hypothetical protein